MALTKMTTANDISESEFLSENKEGIYIDEQHAKMIWQGNKTLIVKSQLFSDKVGKLVYLVGGNNCYGIIKLKGIKPITLEEFVIENGRHRITEAERNLWWPGKQKLFAYEFALVAIFDNPKLVKTSKDSFIESINFLTESEERYKQLINSVKSYNPGKLTTNVLKEDLKLILAMLGSKLSNKKISCSFEDIKTMLKENCSELNKRCALDISLNAGDVKPLVKEIFDTISAEAKSTITSIRLMSAFKPANFYKGFSNENELVEYLFGDN